jgi:hypothetical protein
MALISSTFRNQQYLFYILLAGVLASCSHEKKNIPILKPTELKVEVKKNFMGPLFPSTNFIDKTTEYGLSGVEAINLYAVDVDHDGHTDLVTLDDYFVSPKFYFFNAKSKKFILGPSPFDNIVRASFLNFVDLNHDGIYDVVVGVLNQKTEVTQSSPRLFKGQIENHKIHYIEQAPLPTAILPTASIAALDFDLDGELDFYLANWFSYKDQRGPKVVPDLLLKGNGFNFTDNSIFLKNESNFNRSEKSYTEATPTFGASICDVDQNGFPDVLTSNSNGYYNKLWLNLDGQNFENFGLESGYGADTDGGSKNLGGGNTFFDLCGDYNRDSFIDIVEGNLSRSNDDEAIDKSSILTGATHRFPPSFIRSEFLVDPSGSRYSEGDRRGVWIDYNLDGLDDLIIDNSGFPPDSRLVLFEQAPDHSFHDKSSVLGVNIMNPSGTVTIDVNSDGVMDFISGQSKIRAGDVDNRIYLFENQAIRKNKSTVRFHLQAKKSNYYGISSSLWLTTNYHTYFFNNEYNGGSLPSQNEEGAYFSYGEETAKSVNVKWSYSILDRLGRKAPIVKKYNLSHLKLKGIHAELNLCEDGRVLPRHKDCF